MNVLLSQESVCLGKHTKSHANLGTQGFQASPRLHDYLLQDQASLLLPKERVSNCLKRRIDKKKNRTVMFNEVREKAHWSNVQRCGSIWSCPVCAKRITEARRAEMKQLCDYWYSQQNSDIKLMTLTFSHDSTQPLSFLLSKLKNAITRFFAHRSFVSFSNICKIKYKVRSFEVTYGRNGWHPHFHILLLTNDIDDLAYQYRDRFASLWINCCVKSGLDAPNMTHGLDIRDGFYAQKYVAKWGLEYEMTKGHVKRGRLSSLTPFDLLQASIKDEDYFFKKPSKLFQEFALSMKGQRQLVWSRGLKSLIGLNDKTDSDIIDETDLDSITLNEVDQIVFDLLTKYKKRHEYLDWQKNDYLNGCLGNGETESNLICLFEKYVSDSEDSEFFHACSKSI